MLHTLKKCASFLFFSLSTVTPAQLLSGAEPISDANAESTCDPHPPNTNFIMADDLGYGEVGCFGQKIIKIPVKYDHVGKPLT